MEIVFFSLVELAVEAAKSSGEQGTAWGVG